MKQTKIAPINILGKQEFMGKEIPVIEGGFGEGKKVILVREVAVIHNTKVGNINQRINDNIKRFREGVDIIDLKTDTSNVSVLQNLNFTKSQIGNAKNIYLLSERGYAKLIKIMDTDLAWDIHDKLIDEYFAMKQFVQRISKEVMAWAELKHAGQEGNTQFLIDSYRKKDAERFNQILIEERDGEEKHITLTNMAEILSEKLGIKVISVDITDFLVHKGYFTLRYFQAMSNGKLRYYYDGSPRIEERPHRQPTEIFIQDVCKQGYAASKKPDERGKITVTAYFVKFIDWFLDNHSKDFLKYMKYNKKGFEVWNE